MKKLVLSGLLLWGFSGAAVAQTMDYNSPEGLAWYASAKLGVALPGEVDTRSPGAAFGFDGKLKFKPGVEASLAVGAIFNENWRGEIEGAYARNDADSFSGNVTAAGVTTATTAAMTGDVTRITFSGLVYYDFTQFGNFVPYLGAGAGVSSITANRLTTNNGVSRTDGTAVGPVAQAAAGFNFDVTDNLSVGVEYNVQVGPEAQTTYTIAAAAVSQPTYTSVLSHALSVSLTGKF